jgi:uncharacterized repeat protein (TIGR01451 family)
VTPDFATLASRAAASPGSLWLIGNEIERRDWNGGGQDEILPELYATAFHQIRSVIKTADPTAKIGLGSLVEATPLRLRYLDRVWSSYNSQFGYSMGQDIDVWNIHGFILREVRNSWGAEIPAGLSDTGGFLYGATTAEVLAAHRNIAYFQQFTEALRAWMAAHGERNKPLINTEYGILYKQLGGGQITPQQVSQYLIDSFDYLLTKTDPATGFPADENRLVQGWVWYSLNDDSWNGNLFNPNTQTLTAVGTTWKNYVSDPAKPLAAQPQRNLRPLNLQAAPNPAYVLPGNVATITLKVAVANSGNTHTATGDNVMVKFWDGIPNAPGSHQIGSTQILKDIPGCGGVASAQVNWQKGAGTYAWYVKVEPITGETNVNDNTASSTVTIVEGTPNADVAVVKTVDNATPGVGETIHYRLTVINNGPDPAYSIVVTDVLPAGLSFLGYSSGQGTYNSSTGKWTVGNLAAGRRVSLILTADVNPDQLGKRIRNSASVSSAGNDAVPGNDTTSIDVVPIASPPADTFIHLPLIYKRYSRSAP